MIKQHSPEWLKEKQSRVGASEIAGLVHYYCKDELKALNIEFEPYNTALQTWAKIKLGVELPFPKSLSRWGLGMEQFTADLFNRSQKEIHCVRSDDFIIKDDLSACSPDGYVDICGVLKVPDFDKQVMIDSSWGVGVLEMKTSTFWMKDDFIDGFKWHYIFQNQYQMFCDNLNWGVGVLLLDKNGDNDDMDKGIILGKVLEKIKTGSIDLEEVDDLFYLDYFVYARKPKLIELIEIALEKFKAHLDSNTLPNVYKGTKQTLLYNEKKVLGMINQARFGRIEADEEMDNLLTEMQITQAEKKKLEVEELALRNQIIQKMGDNLGVFGSQYQANFDSRLALRFKKVK